MSGDAKVDLRTRIWLTDALRSGHAMRLVNRSGASYEEVAVVVGTSKMQVFRYLNGLVLRPRAAHAVPLAQLLRELEAMTRED